MCVYAPPSVSHTTRPQRDRESHGRDYYFIDESTFTRAAKSVRPVLHVLYVLVLMFCMQGEFVQRSGRSRSMYGLTMAAIEQVAQQGLACVTHMSIEVTACLVCVMLYCTCLLVIHRVYWLWRKLTLSHATSWHFHSHQRWTYLILSQYLLDSASFPKSDPQAATQREGLL